MRLFSWRPLRLLLLLPVVSCSGGDEPEGAAGQPGSGSAGQPSAGSAGSAGQNGGGGAGQAGAAAGAGSGGAAGAMAGTAGAGAAGSAGMPGGSGGDGTGGASAAGSSGSAGSSSGSSGESGTAGSSGTGGATPGLESCPAPPDGSPEDAVIALNTENEIRLAMGLDCAELVPELVLSAQNHCDYYVANEGDDMCEAPSPHDEIEGCPEFTGEGLGDRIRAAGYMLRGSASECMAFSGDPARSTMQFVDSVYHRTPVLDPWMRHLGYGGGDGCDTIDYGTGPMTDMDVTAFYPYADQTNVPVSFDGSREGPEPPEPSSGWPSGYPVTLYGQDLEVTSHAIFVDGTEEELAHLWLAENDSTLPDYAKVLYTEAPLTANTTYRVVIEATRAGDPLVFDWKFTTGAGRTRP